MDFTYINSRNLKISLTKEDLLKNRLDTEKLDYSNTKTKRFIWELLDIAYSKTGFDAGAEKIHIKLFPSADGGCELFVTKDEHKCTLPDHSYGVICTVDDCENLYMLCARLKSCGYRGKSSLYSAENLFILICTNIPRLPSYTQVPKDCAAVNSDLLAEYGKVCTLNDITMAYVTEHYKLICADNAVQKITKQIST